MMWFVFAFIVSGVITLFAYTSLTRYHYTQEQIIADDRHKLRAEIQQAEDDFAALREELAELQKEITLRTHEIERVQESQLAKGAKDEMGDDRSQIESRWLLQNGHITLEQYDKARQRMETLSMDFTAACLALGFINSAIATQAKKA